jgi:AP-3 complex subunit delta-1
VAQDVTSPSALVIALPLTAIPHIISPSMANSLLSEILPRMTHSNPSIRKKTIVTLYRLALAYPDTLRPAWPKIKERLLDEDENPGVTSAIVNVVCELGWRRPQDFLPLAPRLFDLLVADGDNWMAIKLIKLVSCLPSFYLTTGLIALVCDVNSFGTSTDQETSASIDNYNKNYTCNVAALRGRQRNN